MSSKAQRSWSRRWKWKWRWNNVTAEHTRAGDNELIVTCHHFPHGYSMSYALTFCSIACAHHITFLRLFLTISSSHLLTNFRFLVSFLRVCSVTCFRAIGPEIKSQIEKVSCGSIDLYFSSLNILGRAPKAEVWSSRSVHTQQCWRTLSPFGEALSHSTCFFLAF